MDKVKWSAMTDEQKTTFMREVFKKWHIGESFDYAECRKKYENMKRLHVESARDNPCVVLELIDPNMTPLLYSWLMSKYDEKGEYDCSGITAPMFGYKIETLYYDKISLMDFTDEEKEVLRSAMRILEKRGIKE